MAGLDPNIRMQTQVEIFLSARGLPKLDVMSNTDPFAVLYIKQGGSWVELAKTETIDDTQEPNWTTQILVDYRFEEYQEMRVEVYDQDGNNRDQLQRHDDVGHVEFPLSQLMGAAGQALNIAMQARNNAAVGTLTIRGEEVNACNDLLSLTLAASKLDNKDGFFGKSDPFVRLNRLREDESWMAVWQNEPVMNNLSPVWPRAEIPLQVLCNGDIDRPMKLEVWDWDSDGSHDLIGELQVSVRQLLALSGTNEETPVINEAKKAKKRSYKNSGKLIVMQAAVQRRGTLLEFVRGGCEISLAVAIDFTASNGDPNNPGTLHYMDPSGQTLNAYQAAILNIGRILSDYDADKQFPVYGFGGVPLSTGVINHCFPLTFAEDPHVQGVQGILQAYNNAMRQVRLSGPTLFAPLLGAITQWAASLGVTQESQKYVVLLLLTDGTNHDMAETINAVVAASQLPLSIVVVGVGNADFSAMEALDGDDGVLRNSQGQPCARDIVQFVPFNQFANNPAELAKQTLAEIPDQLVNHFNAIGITPNAPAAAMAGGAAAMPVAGAAAGASALPVAQPL